MRETSTAGSARVVLVTGASFGIGAATATHLASRGLRVFGASRRGTAPSGVEALTLDVREDASVQAYIYEVLRRAGRLDVNNCGAWRHSCQGGACAAGTHGGRLLL